MATAQHHTAQPDEEQMTNIKETQSVAVGEAGDNLWRPVWLHQSVLVVFILCFVALLAVLEAIYQISGNSEGLVTASQGQSYLWTYGPTAILTLVLALWNRVDFRIRQMAPWSAMCDGMLTSNTSALFKDYISPTNPEILWQSFRARDLVVTASTLVVNLLTLLIIVSTGLLTLELRSMRHGSIPYRTTTKFILDDAGSLALSVSSLPVDTLDAIDTMNLPYPMGTTPNLAFQSFEPMSDRASVNELREASVHIVVFDLGCVDAALHVENWTYVWPQCLEDPSVIDTPTENIDISVSNGDCTVFPLLEYNYGQSGANGAFAFFDFAPCSPEYLPLRTFASPSALGLLDNQGQQ